jgi:serine phosphatase RsbU (regulator of sigma subunit)
MYTDGISEAHNASEMFDLEGIVSTLEKSRDCPPDETLEALFEAASDLSDGHLADDAAVIIVERHAD